MLSAARQIASRRPISHRHVVRNASRSLSTTSTSSAFSRIGSTAALVGVGGGALVASYFLWPDPSRAAPTKKDALLSPTHFTPVRITSSQTCPDPDTRLMTLSVPSHSVPSLEETAFQPIWSIYIKDDDIQVERPFTPLEGMDADGNIKLWVKRYDKGEVGRWLHAKEVGDTIEIRGPLKTWPWKDDEWDEVVMISGGTGITPFCQLLHRQLLSQPSSNTRTRFTLLHSSRRPIELPPAEMLQPLITYSQAHPEKLRLSLFVDSTEGPTHPAVPPSMRTVGRIGKEAIERAIGREGRSWWRGLFGTFGKTRSQQGGDGKKIMFLVCGPDPMVAAIAGPFGRTFSQGEVGGSLGELGYDRDSVWKL